MNKNVTLQEFYISFQILVFFLLLVTGRGQKPIESGSIYGIITDHGEPVVGAQVWIEQLEIGDVTNLQGEYNIGNLGDGSYTITVSYIGYELEKVGHITISDGNRQSLNIQLTKKPVELEELLVTPKEEYFDPTGITARLNTRMIQEAPGAAQDIFLVLQTLPGVSSGGDDSKLYIRGGKPDENLVLYDGATIINPFHFDIIGGGFYTIFNSSLIEKVEFYSGGFPARYGDRLSAVMVIDNRVGNRQQSGVELSLSMADIKGLLEFPIGEKASSIITVRRSYFDLLLGGTGFGGEYDLLPFFYDVNSKTDIFLTDKHRLSINLLYSKEKMSGEFDEPHWIGTHKWASENWTTAVRFRSLFSKYLASDLNVYWSEGNNRASHASGVGTENSRKGEIGLKQDIALFQGNHEFHLGGWFIADRGSMEIKLPMDLAYNFEEMYFESDGQATKLAAYFEDTWKVNSLISLNYGLRGDYIIPSSETILSPRFNVVITPSTKVQFTANYGIYSQSPPGYELENNPSLKSRLSNAFGLGINGKITAQTYWSFEVYKKQLFHLMTFDSMGNFSNNGFGSVSGYELYIQKNTGDQFTGWFSYTYSVAKRKEGTAPELTLFNYDQTHMFSAVGQYRPNEKWKLSIRFRYATGRPYTPAEGGYFNSDYERYFPYVGERNSSRYSPYHRLDLRASRYYREILGGMTIYIETINTYNRDNVAYYVWSDDFSDAKNFTLFPFLPILGIDLKL